MERANDPGMLGGQKKDGSGVYSVVEGGGEYSGEGYKNVDGQVSYAMAMKVLLLNFPSELDGPVHTSRESEVNLLRREGHRGPLEQIPQLMPEKKRFK